MNRFAIFVDGSNLMGALKHLNIEIADYELLYRLIFEQAAQKWQQNFYPKEKFSAQLLRVYWYALSEIDTYEFDNHQTIENLKKQFLQNRDLKSKFMQEAGKKLPSALTAQVEQECFQLWINDIKTWYDSKVRQVKGFNDFYHGLESSTEFIEVRRCGRWKVNLFDKVVEEKGVDTALAVDMVGLISEYDVALLVSGDADSIPSLRYAKEKGRQVGVVDFIKGHPPEVKGRNFSMKLKPAADFLVQIYQIDLTRQEGLIKTAKKL